MKQLEVGQPAWIVGEDNIYLSDGDMVDVVSINDSVASVSNEDWDGNIIIPVNNLSPYPPVKAVDGWAVVNGDNIIVTMVATKPEINWLAANGFRCIKGQFIPDNDNS